MILLLVKMSCATLANARAVSMDGVARHIACNNNTWAEIRRELNLKEIQSILWKGPAVEPMREIRFDLKQLAPKLGCDAALPPWRSVRVTYAIVADTEASLANSAILMRAEEYVRLRLSGVSIPLAAALLEPMNGSPEGHIQWGRYLIERSLLLPIDDANWFLDLPIAEIQDERERSKWWALYDGSVLRLLGITEATVVRTVSFDARNGADAAFEKIFKAQWENAQAGLPERHGDAEEARFGFKERCDFVAQKLQDNWGIVWLPPYEIPPPAAR